MGALDGLATLPATLLDQVSLGSRAGTLNRVTGGSYDPATGTITGGSSSAIACRFAQVSYQQSQFPDTLIEAGDRVILVAATTIGVVPNPDGDTFTADGEVWAIIAVEPIQTGDLDAAYELLLRS